VYIYFLNTDATAKHIKGKLQATQITMAN